MNKKQKLDKLFEEMGKCQKCKNLKSRYEKDYSLINIFEDKEFCKNIPSIWTDWYNRLDADIMIIGQDWGPFSDMKKLNEQYIKKQTKENWINLIETERSNTKKLLAKYIMESSNGKMTNLDKVYITNAIMCARQGDSYRGNNINLKSSTKNCEKFLKTQIEIANPKIILTLGYYPLKALSNIYEFEIQETLKESIMKAPIIKNKSFVIIPLFHPVAQITKYEQLQQYNRIWDYI